MPFPSVCVSELLHAKLEAFLFLEGRALIQEIFEQKLQERSPVPPLLPVT